MDYTNYKDSSENLDEVVYMIVLDLPIVPNIVTNWAQLPNPTLNVTWANGTSMGLMALVFIGLGFTGGHFGLPVGNWTFIEELATDASWTNTTIDNGATYFKVSARINFFSFIYEVTTEFLKSDGFLARYSLSAVNATSSQTIGEVSVIRQGLGGDFGSIIALLQDNLRYVAVCFGFFF